MQYRYVVFKDTISYGISLANLVIYDRIMTGDPAIPKTQQLSETLEDKLSFESMLVASSDPRAHLYQTFHGSFPAGKPIKSR